jgi:hypothetical protein
MSSFFGRFGSNRSSASSSQGAAGSGPANPGSGRTTNSSSNSGPSSHQTGDAPPSRLAFTGSFSAPSDQLRAQNVQLTEKLNTANATIKDLKQEITLLKIQAARFRQQDATSEKPERAETEE